MDCEDAVPDPPDEALAQPEGLEMTQLANISPVEADGESCVCCLALLVVEPVLFVTLRLKPACGHWCRELGRCNTLMMLVCTVAGQH